MKDAVKKKKDRRSISFLTILEMICSLLLIPNGFFYTRYFNEPVLDEGMSAIMMVEFILLALSTFLRAISTRYRNQFSRRRTLDFIFSGLFLAGVVVLYFKPDSPKIHIGLGVLFMLSLLPRLVFSVLQSHRWYKVAINALLALLILFMSVDVWFEMNDPETLILFLSLVMIMIALRGFCRVMSVTFARLRLDLLRNIVRQTYAAEIIFGLVLLILSFSWVLMYTDEAFPQFTDALWYCFAVVTTIGFGDITATSVIGRILSVMLGIYGIIVVALITSIIVNFYGEMKKTGGDEEEAEKLPEGQEKEEEAEEETL